MSSFPDIALPDIPFKEKWEDRGMIFQPEDGPDISRSRKTKSRGTFWLTWKEVPLSDSDYQTLKTFIKITVAGSSQTFDWTHPVDHTGYIVRCIDFSEFEWAADGNPGWSGGIVLKEA